MSYANVDVYGVMITKKNIEDMAREHSVDYKTIIDNHEDYGIGIKHNYYGYLFPVNENGSEDFVTYTNEDGRDIFYIEAWSTSHNIFASIFNGWEQIVSQVNLYTRLFSDEEIKARFRHIVGASEEE